MSTTPRPFPPGSGDPAADRAAALANLAALRAQALRQRRETEAALAAAGWSQARIATELGPLELP